MKYIKTFEMSRLRNNPKVNDYKKYVGKWVVVKAFRNGEITIAEFKKIESFNNSIYLYIPENSPFSAGGYCVIPISEFEVLDSCDNKEETEEMLNNAKIKEESKKFNI